MWNSIEKIEQIIRELVGQIDYRVQVNDLETAEVKARILEHLTAARANLAKVPNA